MAKKSLAERAWNSTKSEGDPDWDSIPNIEFKGKLQFAADKVVETGIANTNFEKAVAKFAAKEDKDDAAMAVVEDKPGVDLKAAAEGLEETKSESDTVEELKKESDTVPDRLSGTTKAKAGKAKGDQSGHVPTAKEAAAIKKEQAKAPRHP